MRGVKMTVFFGEGRVKVAADKGKYFELICMCCFHKRLSIMVIRIKQINIYPK